MAIKYIVILASVLGSLIATEASAQQKPQIVCKPDKSICWQVDEAVLSQLGSASAPTPTNAPVGTAVQQTYVPSGSVTVVQQQLSPPAAVPAPPPAPPVVARHPAPPSVYQQYQDAYRRHTANFCNAAAVTYGIPCGPSVGMPGSAEYEAFSRSFGAGGSNSVSEQVRRLQQMRDSR